MRNGFRLLFISILMAIFGQMEAQIIKGEVFAGANLTQVDGDECFGFKKFGANAGVGALIPVTKFMDIGVEVLYSQKGARKRDTVSSNSTFAKTYKLNLDYVEVPLMIYLTDKDRFSIGIGVSYGRLVRLVEEENGVGTGIEYGDGCLSYKEGYNSSFDLSKIKEINLVNYLPGTNEYDNEEAKLHGVDINQLENSTSYRPHTANIIGSIRIRIWQGLHAEMRYEYSLTRLRTRVFSVNSVVTDNKLIHHQYNNSLNLRLVYIFNERRAKDIREGGFQSPR